MSDLSRGVGPALVAEGLTKVYPSGEGRELHVLRGASLHVDAGESVAIVGASGAGKSTLLHLLGALDTPTAGEVRVEGRRFSGLEDTALAALRNAEIGFVFQFHHLLREFTALENVVMPRLIGGGPLDEARVRAKELLGAVGLSERLHHKPNQLSGGEQQRVAVARAIANEPSVLLADEPSGNLDAESSRRLHDLLFEVQSNSGLAMVLVTHNRTLAERADRIVVLEDGILRPELSGIGGTA